MGSARATTSIILLAGLGLTGCAGVQDPPASAPLTAEGGEPSAAATDAPQGAPLPAFEPSVTEAPVPVATFEGITGAYFQDFPNNPGSGCVLTPDQVQQTLAAWVPAGEVTLDEEYSTNWNQCTYRIGENTLPGGGTYSMSDSTGLTSVSSTRYPYVIGEGYTSSSADGEWTVEGTTAQEVVDNATIAFRSIKAAGDTSGPPILRPEVGNGLVIEGAGDGFVLTAQDHWYDVGFSGTGVSYDPALVEALAQLASAIAENE